jgi:hypothetical protein
MTWRRSTPRRRDAPRWTPPEWRDASMALLRRSGGRCECCGADLRGRAERSHRVRRRDGGDRLSNLLLVLPEHHVEFHHRPVWAKGQGFQLYPHDDPAARPVHYRGQRWVMLDDDGGMTDCDPPAD